MRRTAVLVCPGRGSYNKAELGTLTQHHGGRPELAVFDALREAEGQETLTALDGAARFSAAKHTAGGAASPLIYAASYLDAQMLADDIEVVAVTGNSMGWYIALAVAGAVSAENGFRLVNTMGTLMEAEGAGGQILVPVTEQDWRPDPERKARILAQVSEIGRRPHHALSLSIDLGGTLVLAGNNAGLAAAEAEVAEPGPRLPNHAAFHSALVAPVAAAGRARLPVSMVRQPDRPLIDGRGHVWWPQAIDPRALWDYTLGHQVTEHYDFTRAIQTAAREFAPDLFILTGPGSILGGGIAQSLIAIEWRGMGEKADFQRLQETAPVLLSMGREDQRAAALGAANVAPPS